MTLRTRLDAVVAVILTMLVLTLFGNSGVGTAQAQSSGTLIVISASLSAADVALGDLNRDGCPDACIGTQNDRGLVLLAGSRSREWTTMTAAGLPATGTFTAVALADLDRNGLLDVVAAEGAPGLGGLVVYRQTALGVWTTASGSLPTSGCFATRIVLEDFTRDGRIDIAAAGENGIWLFERILGPAIWGPAVHPQASAGKYTGLAFFDWSGDGRPDLVASCEDAGGAVRYWTQPAAGPLWLRQPNASPARPYRALQEADINHDGTPDLLEAHDGGLEIHSGAAGWPELSAGFVEAPVRSAFVVGNWPIDPDLEVFASDGVGLSVFTGQPGSTWHRRSIDPAAASLKLLEMADCDRDGAPDIAGVSLAQRACVYYNPGTSGTVSWIENSLPSRPPYLGQSFDAGDADRDGDADLMIGRDDVAGGVAYFTGDGGASWRDATVAELPQFSSFSLVALEDFDFDGYEDAFFLNKRGDGIHYSKRRPTLWVKSEPIGPPADYATMTFADFRLPIEAVVACPRGGEALHFFTYAPDPNLGTWTRTVVDTGGDSVAWVAAGDFNGDRFDEIACADSDGALFLFTWVGATWQQIRAGVPQNLHVTKFIVADLDGDSLDDLLAIGQGGAIFAILNRQPAALVKLVDDKHVYASVSVADCNLDGIPDILATHADGVELFAGDAATSWPASVSAATPEAGDHFTDAAFAFLDKDGAIDFGAVQVGGHVRMFYNRDGSPPGGWIFDPTGWVRAPNPDCRARVQDNVGLSSPTASYSYSTDGGATWSAPQMPEYEQLSPDNTHGALWARAVPFPASSRDQYRIRFTIQDVNGNVGDSPEYTVRIDADPPTNPALIFTGAHARTVWNRVNRIQYSWPAGDDPVSGVAGYSVEIDHTSDTLPNESTEFGASERLQRTLSLADGMNWYIHLRTIDNAGNVAVDAVHVGPFWIDAHRPTSPTITINGLAPSAWPLWFFGHQIITIQRGTDGGSQADDVRFLINHNPISDPSLIGVLSHAEITTRSSEAFDDSRPLYIHAVTIDRAGNISPIAHAGPAQFDVQMPYGQITVSPDNDAGTRTQVDAYNIRDAESGVRRWFLLYRLPGAGLDYTTYSTQVYVGPEQTVYFTPPNPLQEYELAARFEDNVGRTYLTYWYSTRFERTVTVEVEVEVPPHDGPPYWVPREGAQVFNRNVRYTTNASGRVRIPNVYIGDTITTLYKVKTEECDRRDTDPFGGDAWAYHVYLTNVNFADDGTSSGHIVTSMDSPIVLRCRRLNTLVGFHLVAGLEWNATNTYHQYLQRVWRNASNYLYNCTDGQMFLEQVDILDNQAYWDDGDVRTYLAPLREHASINGLYSSRHYKKMHLDAKTDHMTMIHELGHYGLGLYDEYRSNATDVAWNHDSTCTLHRGDVGTSYSSGQVFSACVMDKQWYVRNFCDILPDNPHNTDTAQQTMRGMACWPFLLLHFGDPSLDLDRMRWLMRSPFLRGRHVAGPNYFPSTYWMRTNSSNDVDSLAYDAYFTFQRADGTPMDRDDVYLVRNSGTEINMGRTSRDGRILLINVCPDDRVHLVEDGVLDHYFDLPDDPSEIEPIIVPVPGEDGLPDAADISRAAAGRSIVLRAEALVQPGDFTLDLSPGTTLTLLRVQLRSAKDLAEPPLLMVRLADYQGWITTQEMTPGTTTGLFLANVLLPYLEEPMGKVSIRTLDWEGKIANVSGDFRFIAVDPVNERQEWGPSGGALQIQAEPNAFSTGTILSISKVGAPTTGPLAFVKGPFRISSNNGTSVTGPVGIIMAYATTDNVMRADLNQLAMYKRNEATGAWERLESHHSLMHGEVSRRMFEFGTYAVAGPALPPATSINPRYWRLY